ncbi:MAG: phosphatase PAP2 family protein [Parafilimonas sp.]|nr:phosphatase PAP2 family protein [Parafilimonas sp.]
MENEAPSSFKKTLQLISIEVLVVSILFIVSLFVFALIAKGVVTGNEDTFDNEVFNFFNQFTSPGFITAMKFFTFLGSVEFLIPAYIILIAFFVIKKLSTYTIDIIAIALSSTALIFILKYFFHRSRPTLPIIRTFSTYSFPSGHMLSSFVFCSILAFIVIKSPLKTFYKWIISVLLFFFAITIGISRIVLKAHFPTDVIASLCLGIVWVIGSFYILKRIDREYITKKK